MEGERGGVRTDIPTLRQPWDERSGPWVLIGQRIDELPHRVDGVVAADLLRIDTSPNRSRRRMSSVPPDFHPAAAAVGRHRAWRRLRRCLPSNRQRRWRWHRNAARRGRGDRVAVGAASGEGDRCGRRDGDPDQQGFAGVGVVHWKGFLSGEPHAHAAAGRGGKGRTARARVSSGYRAAASVRATPAGDETRRRRNSGRQRPERQDQTRAAGDELQIDVPARESNKGQRNQRSGEIVRSRHVCYLDCLQARGAGHTLANPVGSAGLSPGAPRRGGGCRSATSQGYTLTLGCQNTDSTTARRASQPADSKCRWHCTFRSPS